jgi:hypothetical protein
MYSALVFLGNPHALPNTVGSTLERQDSVRNMTMEPGFMIPSPNL